MGKPGTLSIKDIENYNKGAILVVDGERYLILQRSGEVWKYKHGRDSAGSSTGTLSSKSYYILPPTEESIGWAEEVLNGQQ